MAAIFSNMEAYTTLLQITKKLGGKQRRNETLSSNGTNSGNIHVPVAIRIYDALRPEAR